MSDKVSFELASPEALVVSQEVDSVVVPSRAGDIGVLPGHAPVISALRPGTICIFEGRQVSRLESAGTRSERESHWTEVTLLTRATIPCECLRAATTVGVAIWKSSEEA